MLAAARVGADVAARSTLRQFTLRLYEIPDGARVTTVVGDRRFVTTRDGSVIRVEGPAGDWQVWHAGQAVTAAAGAAEITLPG